jgi:hypothetical protein
MWITFPHFSFFDKKYRLVYTNFFAKNAIFALNLDKKKPLLTRLNKFGILWLVHSNNYVPPDFVRVEHHSSLLLAYRTYPSPILQNIRHCLLAFFFCP